MTHFGCPFSLDSGGDGLLSRNRLPAQPVIEVKLASVRSDERFGESRRLDHLQRVAKTFDGKTIFTAEQVEDVVAYLATLKE